MTTPLLPRDAAAMILGAIEPQPPLRVPLDDALGSVLSAPVNSPIDVPPWTNSAMDGYAVRASDIAGASPTHPVSLRVVATIPAGAFPSRPIGAGECVRIFTGAPVPDGADSVVRQEDTDLGHEVVAIRDAREAGANLRQAGEDIARGREVFAAGTELTPARIGVLASLAVAHPLVHRRPRVAILGSGDEIVDVDQPEAILSGRKIASSNTHTLMALVRDAGGIPVNLGVAADTHESLRAHLALAGDADLLVTTAGISVGAHDHLREVLAELGVGLRFWRLRMRPGAPVGFGLMPGDPARPWIGLPGNPVSTMVTFELFVRPAIRRMMGHARPFRRTTTARLAEPVRTGGTLRHFLRAIISPGPDGALEARLTGPQGSGILTSMARANALLVVPEGESELPAGAVATVLRLDEPEHREACPW